MRERHFYKRYLYCSIYKKLLKEVLKLPPGDLLPARSLQPVAGLHPLPLQDLAEPVPGLGRDVLPPLLLLLLLLLVANLLFLQPVLEGFNSALKEIFRLTPPDKKTNNLLLFTCALDLV